MGTWERNYRAGDAVVQQHSADKERRRAGPTTHSIGAAARPPTLRRTTPRGAFDRPGARQYGADRPSYTGVRRFAPLVALKSGCSAAERVSER